MKKIVVKFCWLVLMMSPLLSSASVKSELDRWYDAQSFSNVTAPGVYEGQSARYATAGGFSQRNDILSSFRFLEVQMPKFSAGCGGIDLYSGGFSAINSDQFIQNLRAIGQNAKGLAFMLAIQIVSPQLAGVMEQIQTWADKYLNLSMGSCEAATALVEGVAGMNIVRETNCIVRRMASHGENWTTAKAACTTEAKMKETESQDGKANEIAFVQGNLAWYVLMQDPLFTNNLELAELVMNLTGTVIIKDTDDSSDSPTSHRVVKGTVLDNGELTDRGKNIFNALLLGSEAETDLKLYKCTVKSGDPYDCPELTQELMTVNRSWEGLKGRVEVLIKDILLKMDRDEHLTNEEKGMLSTTSIPLYHFLVAASTYFPPGTNLSKLTNDFSQLIAEDILTRGLGSMLDMAREAADNLPGGISVSTQVKELSKNLKTIRQSIAAIKRRNQFDTKTYFEMRNQAELFEQAILAKRYD